MNVILDPMTETRETFTDTLQEKPALEKYQVNAIASIKKHLGDAEGIICALPKVFDRDAVNELIRLFDEINTKVCEAEQR